jgi:hypothetical protein
VSKKTEIISRLKTWRKYHIPGQAHFKTVKMNACFISAANSKEHELKKAEICWDLRCQGHDYITEAAKNQKEPDGSERRVDVVDLESGIEYEVETDPRRAARFKGMKGVEVIQI